MSKMKRLRVGPNQARIFQRTVRPYSYVVQLSRDMLPPLLASPQDAFDHISLEMGDEKATYEPSEIAKEGGIISLQRVTLTLGPEKAQTSDGVAVNVTATIEFKLVENRRWLTKLLEDGALRSLGRTLAARARATIQAEMGEVNYDTAIGTQTIVTERIENRLSLSVAGSPYESDEHLGISIIEAHISVDRRDEHRTGSLGGDSQMSERDFDLKGKADRLMRFLREHNPSSEERMWIAARLDSLVGLERARVLASGTSTVVIADNPAQVLENSSLGDVLSLPEDEAKRPELIDILPMPRVDEKRKDDIDA